MRDIIRPVPPSPEAKDSPLKGRLGWFVLLYVSGLVAVTAFSYGIRFLMFN